MNGRSPTGLTLPQSNEISSSWWPPILDMSLFPPSDGTYAIIPPDRQASGRRPSYTVHCPVTLPSRLSPKMLGLPHLRDCVSRVLISHACAREHTHMHKHAHTNTHVHTYTCMHTCKHTCTHAHTLRTCTGAHTNTPIQAHTYTHMHTHKHTHAHITCTHKYTHIHTHSHPHIHAHTNAHTHTPSS